MTKNIKTGKDTVVIGNVTGEVGDGSVVIGPTDANGNTIINQPMAVGKDAKAGPESIAIGAGASAGSDIFHLIDALRAVPELQNNATLLSNIDVFRTELKKENSDLGALQTLWSTIQLSATTGGAIGFVQQITQMLGF